LRSSWLEAQTSGAHGAQLRRAIPLTDAARGALLRTLRTCFNVLALNLVLVLTCLPVLTVPLAVQAGTVALERWRVAGEDRVVREFLAALRSTSPWRTTLTVGTPLAVAAVAAEEVHFFARGGEALDWISLGFGAAALLVAMTSLGYVLLLGGRRPPLDAVDVWYLSVRLAMANLFVTGPLFVAELVVTALALLLDPALGLIGLPLGLLWSLWATAKLGANRVGFPAAGR
jgi:hypothetical protein